VDGCVLVLDSSKISADGRYSWQRRASVYGIHSGVPSLVGNSSKLCQLCVKECPFVGSVGSVESYLLSASYKKLHGPGAHTERLVGGLKNRLQESPYSLKLPLRGTLEHHPHIS